MTRSPGLKSRLAPTLVVPRLKEVQSSLRARLRLIYSRNLLPRASLARQQFTLRRSYLKVAGRALLGSTNGPRIGTHRAPIRSGGFG